MKTNMRGFTLIELSIVLIIIGLLVGGVLAGRELVQQAKLNKITAEFTQYRTAVNTFRIKYDGLPGDFENAYGVWPDAGCTDSMVEFSNPGGCNGDGNFQVERGKYESLRAWQQLGLAGLIDAQYAGEAATNDWYIPGETVPFGPVANSAWNYGTHHFDDPDGFRHFSSGFLLFGNNSGNQSLELEAVLTPAETFALDEKMDDGFPYMGVVWGLPSLNSADSSRGNCTTDTGNSSPYELDALYQLSEDAASCAPYFLTSQGSYREP